MRPADAARLRDLAEALYLREMRAIAGVLAEEAALRAALAGLDRQAAQAQTELDRDPAMKSVGADLMWQGWQTRTRRRLNIELAQVIARKLGGLDAVRTAFGRRQALDGIAAAAAVRRRQDLTRRRDEMLLAPACLGRDGG